MAKCGRQGAVGRGVKGIGVVRRHFHPTLGPVDEVPVGRGNRGEAYRVTRVEGTRPGHRTPGQGVGGGGDDVLLGEVGDDGLVPVHGQVGRVRAPGQVSGPFHEVIPGVGVGRQLDGGAVVVGRLAGVLGHRAAADLAGAQGVGVDGEGRLDRVVAGDLVEGVGGDRPLGVPVYQHVIHVVAGGGGDAEGLVGALDHVLPRRRVRWSRRGRLKRLWCG